MRLSRIEAGQFLCVLASLGAGCGTETEITLQLGTFECPPGAVTLRSLELFVLEQTGDSGGQPVLQSLPGYPECIDVSAALTWNAVAQVFVHRGYVARAVSTERPTVVVIHGRLLSGCQKTDPLLLCLMSDSIPPHSQPSVATMNGVCAPPPGQPVPAAWQRCSTALPL